MPAAVREDHHATGSHGVAPEAVGSDDRTTLPSLSPKAWREGIQDNFGSMRTSQTCACARRHTNARPIERKNRSNLCRQS